MKVALIKETYGFELKHVIDNYWETRDCFIGYVDLPVEKPKKVVTKEACPITDWGGYLTTSTPKHFAVPHNAKNVKCTYDIEE